MPPKRKHGRDLPPNLYPATDKRDGITRYRYRDPRNGRYHGMGTDKAAAIADALALNAVIYAGMAKNRAALIVNPVPDGPKLSAVILKHTEICEERQKRGKLTYNTMKSKRSNGKAIRLKLGHKPISEVTVGDMADLLEMYVEAGKERAAQSIRSEAIEIWKTAIAKGYTTVNIPAMTLKVDVAVKRSRLSLDMWRAVRASVSTKETWAGLSMDLAMLTAQRVEDICLFEFRPREGASAWVEDGYLWVIQSKTGNRVCIPLTLRNEALGLELGEVVAQCRDLNVSRYLCHHTRPYGNAPVGSAISKQTMSKAFTAAVRASGIEWEEGKTAPTFHEQRSLAIRLYSTQGIDAQALAGHKDAATTALYRDVRGSEWISVKAG